MSKTPGNAMVGITYIELIVSMVILSVCMLGVYGVIDAVARHHMEPQKIAQAINLADYFRDQMLFVSQTSCQQPNESIAPLVNSWCQDPKAVIQHAPSLDKLEGLKGWALKIDSRLTTQDIYLVSFEVTYANRLILKTNFLKEVL